MLVLVANGFTYALFVCIQASTSLLFQVSYPSLTQVEIGLCFLPMGSGMVLSSLVTGRLLDYKYRTDRAKWEGRMGHEKPYTKEEELTFPIEKTRLKWAVGYTLVIVVVGVGYGWATLKAAPLAIPLILQFLGECEGFTFDFWADLLVGARPRCFSWVAFHWTS